MATDDPREVLKAAGVECAEVEAWVEKVFTGEFSEMQTVPEALSIIGPLREVVVTSNAAILALARLVAELEAERDALRDGLDDIRREVLAQLPTYSPTTKKLINKVFARRWAEDNRK